MSLVHLDSCGDGYSTSELADRFTISGVSPLVVAEAGRNGSAGIQCSATTEFFERAVPSNDTYFCGVSVKIPSVSTSADAILFGEAGVDHIIIRVLSTGAVQALRGATILGTSASVNLFLPSSAAYVEAKAVIADGVLGEVIVRVDGIEVLNVAATDTRNGGTGTITRIRYAGSIDVITFDDIYILNDTGAAPQNTFLGDTRVDASFPDGDGATTDLPTLVPASPTTHFDKVNEVAPDGDIGYVASSTPADLDLFTFEPLPTVNGPTTIFGVQLNLYAKKDNDGGRQVVGLIRPIATNYDGSTGTLINTYEYFSSIWDNNPETAAAWNIAEKDASEFGVRVQ